MDDDARLYEHLSDAELRDRAVIEAADFYTLAGGWLIASPDDPEMRRFLIEDEAMAPYFADAVIAKMRAQQAARVKAGGK